MNSNPSRKKFRERATAVWNVIPAAVEFAAAAARLAPTVASMVLRDFIARVRLRIRGEKCAVCRVPISRRNEFRLHPQAGWVCPECDGFYNHGARALADAFLDYHGITRDPLT